MLWLKLWRFLKKELQELEGKDPSTKGHVPSMDMNNALTLALLKTLSPEQLLGAVSGGLGGGIRGDDDETGAGLLKRLFGGGKERREDRREDRQERREDRREERRGEGPSAEKSDMRSVGLFRPANLEGTWKGTGNYLFYPMGFKDIAPAATEEFDVEPSREVVLRGAEISVRLPVIAAGSNYNNSIESMLGDLNLTSFEVGVDNVFAVTGSAPASMLLGRNFSQLIRGFVAKSGRPVNFRIQNDTLNAFTYRVKVGLWVEYVKFVHD